MSEVKKHEETVGEGAAAGKGEGVESVGEERKAGVGELMGYRRRARVAEGRLRELTARLEGLEAELGATRDALEVVERRKRMDAMLVERGVIDVEAGRLLAESLMGEREGMDVEAAVSGLRSRKPHLFRSGVRAGAMGGLSQKRKSGAGATAADAAAEAASSGNRRDVLRYLRLRRGGR